MSLCLRRSLGLLEVGTCHPLGRDNKHTLQRPLSPQFLLLTTPSPGDPDLARGKNLFRVSLGNPSSFFSGSVLILTFGSVEILCQYSQYTNGESRQP